MKIGRLRNLTMSRSSHRSPFAESAYAHARRSSSSRRRRQQMIANEDDPNDHQLMYYEDGTIDRASTATNNVTVHAEFQPLAGSSVVIIANTSKKDKVTDARTLNLMEERESIGATVESFGGSWISTLDGNRNITHAIWIDSGEDNQRRHLQKDISHLSSETLVKLNTCLGMDIPVVSPNWLMKIGELSPGQHWSEVDVEEHVPMTIILFYDVNSSKSHSSPNSYSLGNTTSSSSRRDTAVDLSASINDTYQTLLKENPDVMEEESLKRAMELSMLDFAIVHRTSSKKSGIFHWKKSDKNKSPVTAAAEVLQVDHNASHGEIKNAYRRRALETHPDKGGKPGEFEEVARAYRMLLNAINNDGLNGTFDRGDGAEIPLKSTAHWDSELKEHNNLVRELYQQHGEDIEDHMKRQHFTLERLGLHRKEAGSQNRNEKNELIRNSCFYLSLAASYLSGVGALAVWDQPGEDFESDGDRSLYKQADETLISETALQLKRVIEAAVLSAHPEWAAKGIVGEEVQAFSDFLVYLLESQTIISEWAVVVFDTSSGFVDVYKGQNYKDEEEGVVDETYAASNTLTLRFVPGHYQPLVLDTSEGTRPTLKQIISVLDECGVLYVVTDGAAPE